MPRLSERFVSRPRSPQMKSRNSRCYAPVARIAPTMPRPSRGAQTPCKTRGKLFYPAIGLILLISKVVRGSRAAPSQDATVALECGIVPGRSGGPHRSLPREAADPSGLLPRFVPWIRET